MEACFSLQCLGMKAGFRLSWHSVEQQRQALQLMQHFNELCIASIGDDETQTDALQQLRHHMKSLDAMGTKLSEAERLYGPFGCPPRDSSVAPVGDGNGDDGELMPSRSRRENSLSLSMDAAWALDVVSAAQQLRDEKEEPAHSQEDEEVKLASTSDSGEHDPQNNGGRVAVAGALQVSAGMIVRRSHKIIRASTVPDSSLSGRSLSRITETYNENAPDSPKFAPPARAASIGCKAPRSCPDSSESEEGQGETEPQVSDIRGPHGRKFSRPKIPRQLHGSGWGLGQPTETLVHGSNLSTNQDEPAGAQYPQKLNDHGLRKPSSHRATPRQSSDRSGTTHAGSISSSSSERGKHLPPLAIASSLPPVVRCSVEKAPEGPSLKAATLLKGG